MNNQNESGAALNFLRGLIANGGPESKDYSKLSSTIDALKYFNVPFESIRGCLTPILESPNCLYGLAYSKPRGYAGDFEMIDRIYTGYVNPDPFFGRWDAHCHHQAASGAVRNRKSYFHGLLTRASSSRGDAKLEVLNIGSGPMRDVSEYLKTNRNVHFDCVDLDQEALLFGQSLCRDYEENITLHKQNILRFKTEKKYDLVWSAGLFDYFTDRTFKAALSRLVKFVKPDGKIVIGNFSLKNPTRYWMEAACDWNLIHRSAALLRTLATECGIRNEKITINSEPAGVNLFLHISGGSH